MDPTPHQASDHLYRLGGNPEWGFLLKHLRFNEGFGLFVLLAPEAAGVETCHRALQAHFAEQKRTLHRLHLHSGEHPATLSDTLLRLQPAPATAALWITGPEPVAARDLQPVQHLWHHALAALNSRRNPLRQHLPLPLIFAGPLWLQEVFRVAAPDWWSVRDSVVTIEPRHLPAQGGSERGQSITFSSIDTADEAGDPGETLRAIAKLRIGQAAPPLLAGLLTRLGAQLTARYQWAAAETALLEAWRIIEHHQQSWDEPRRVLGTLCRLYFARGDGPHMEHYARKLYELTNTHFGAEDRRNLSSRNDLANALAAQGKYAEAEREQRALLAISERVLGAEHPDTLGCRINLANALAAQGQHAEAEREQRAVLVIMERVLGAEHSHILASRMNLANALGAQGKYAEEEREQRAALAVRERVLGAEHPDVFRSCFNLALCLKAQKKLKDALTFMRRAEAGWEKTLGAGHPDTKDAQSARERIEAAVKGGE